MSSLLPKSKKSLLSQFRCGALPLATGTGRYRQIPSNERYCTFCDENAIEDEIYFLCTCNFYSKLRDTLFHNINSIEPTVVNIPAMSGIDLLTFLMNDKFVKCVADFISNAWYKRPYLTSTHSIVLLIIIIIIFQVYTAPLYILYMYSD